MYATNHFEEIMLNLARGISASAPETMYLALYLNDPGDDGAGTEVSYSGYARQPITFSAPAASGNGYAMQNTAALTFAESSVSVGNVTYVAIMDSLTGGNMYLYGRLEEVLNISAGIAPVVRAGAVKWIWSGKMANAYKIKCMNICRSVSCSGFSPYLALCNGSPESGGSEFSGNSYARTAFVFSAPAQQSGGACLITNSARIETPVASGPWGELTHVAVYDAESNGEPYIIDAASKQVTMSAGRQVIYVPSTLNFTIN